MSLDSSNNIDDNAKLRVELVDTNKLLLDRDNPRLATFVEKRDPSQFELLKTLWTEMAVDELVLSIAANGYFQEEPLFIIPEAENSNKYIVVEGNRRLAAVLILRNEEYRDRLKIKNMPRLTSEEKLKLAKLPVSIYPNRKDLWAYLSFRHINSPQEWDPYSKAKFVALVHDTYRETLEEISKRIGDQHETVKRLYRGYKILQQSDKYGI